MMYPAEHRPLNSKLAGRLLRIVVALLAVSMLLVAAFFIGMSRAQAGTNVSTAKSSIAGQCVTQSCLSSSQPPSVGQCVTPSSPSQWTPVGSKWDLTVYFLVGSRNPTGKPTSGTFPSEKSIMTFNKDGSLTATFPGATPDAPPTLPPVEDGKWCMTAINAFHYQFRDILMENGKPFVYVQTQINAVMTGPGFYEAGGVGVAYSYTDDSPLPGQCNVTRTDAIAMK